MAHKQHTYKVGDRVRHETYGKGTVKYVNGGLYAVEIDTNIGRHNCSSLGGPHTKDGHGWWCEKHELTPIPFPRKRDASGRFAGAKKTAKKGVITRMKDRGITKRLEVLERQVALNSAAIDVLKSANALLEQLDKEKAQNHGRSHWLTLEGEQADPAMTIIVTGETIDGTKRELIRTCANSIYHSVNLDAVEQEKPQGLQPGDYTEATKPKPYQPQFGDVVEVDGIHRTVSSNAPAHDGLWPLLHEDKVIGWQFTVAAPSEMTLIRRP